MSRQGRAMALRSPLYRHGDWISDGFFMAHRTAPLFSLIWSSMPSRDGTYKLSAGGYTRMNSVGKFPALLDTLLSAELTPARIVEQAPPQQVDIDDAEEATLYQEPWYVDNGDDLLVFDGAVAQTATLTLSDTTPVDAWWTTAPGVLTARPILVGTADGERRFALTSGMPSLEQRTNRPNPQASSDSVE